MEPCDVFMGHKQLFGPNASGKAGVPCNDDGYLCTNAHNACWILRFSKIGLWICGPLRLNQTAIVFIQVSYSDNLHMIIKFCMTIIFSQESNILLQPVYVWAILWFCVHVKANCRHRLLSLSKPKMSCNYCIASSWLCKDLW